MQQLFRTWSRLDPRRRVVALLAGLSLIATLVFMVRLATEPRYALLYAGLDGPAAGEVIAALDARAVPYEVQGNSIYVSSDRRDFLRMALAGEGLPANGASGYELLDSLTGFGTTSQMFDATYLRAIEGELARTIMATPHIRTARVHIANVSRGPFRQSIKPSASVAVTTTNATLTPAQARALRYLVASSVAGLAKEDVTVIDGRGGMVISGADTPADVAGTDRAKLLRSRVERLLAARMGPGRAVVEVSVETLTDQESIVERIFDPDGRVAISTETEERSNSSRDQDAGAVTVASNLPEGNGASNRSSNSSNSETRETTNFEVSETKREVLRAPGAIKRLTVAVLVDGIRNADPSGAETWEPLPDKELDALHDLVASAVGFDEARGDVITLKSMPFEIPEVPAESQDSPGLLANLSLDVTSLIQISVLAVVGLVLGLFVLRPILLSPPSRDFAAIPALAQDGAAPQARRAIQSGNDADAAAPAGVTLEQMVTSSNADKQPEAALLPASDPVERLRTAIAERREETVEIIRHWMESEEERA